MQRILLIVFIIALGPVQAQTFTGYPWCNGCPIEKSKYELVVQSFIDQITTGQKLNIAARVEFPLRRSRDNSIPDIINNQDMLNRFYMVFDADFISEISASKPFENWEPLGYKGIMFKSGKLWLDFDGKIIAINTTSHSELEYVQQAWAGAPVYVVETAKFLIEISKPAQGVYRYTAWPQGADPASKPDIVLNNGSYITYNSEGSHSYHFKNGKYEYCVFTDENPEDLHLEGILRVKKDDKNLFDQTILHYFDTLPAQRWEDRYFQDNLSSAYKKSTFITPSRLEADFNGDKKSDVAMAVEQKGSGKKGVIILHQDVNQHFVLGAGTETGNGGDDFSWMDTWQLETNPTALYVGKMESAGGSIYWTGRDYMWRQQGD